MEAEALIGGCGGKFDGLFGLWRKGHDFLWRVGGFEDEGFAEISFEQMFGGGQAGGGFDGAGKAGDPEEESLGGFFRAQAGAVWNAALA